MKRVSLFMVLAFLAVANATPYTISGDAVYVDDAHAFISASPHTISFSQWVYFNLSSKQFSGDIDVAFGFDTSKVRPKQAFYYNPHNESVQKTYVCEGSFFNYTMAPKFAQCWRNNTYYNSTPNTTTLLFEHAFESGNLSAKTIYWTELNFIEWTDVSDQFDFAPFPYDGKNKWYYLKNFGVTAGQTYQLKAWLEITPQLGVVNGKYDVAIKQSSKSFMEAANDGTLYYLDPWWNTTFSKRKMFFLNNSAGNVKQNEPVTFNFSGLTLASNNCTELRVTANYSTEAELPREIVNSSGQALASGSQWCLVKFVINLTADTTNNATHAPSNATSGWVYYNGVADVTGISQDSRISWGNDTSMLGQPNVTNGWTIYKDGSATWQFYTIASNQSYADINSTGGAPNYIYISKAVANLATVEWRVKAESDVYPGNDGRNIAFGTGSKFILFSLNTTGVLARSTWGGGPDVGIWYLPLSDVNTTFHTYRGIISNGGNNVLIYVDNVYQANLTMGSTTINRIDWGGDEYNNDAGHSTWDYVAYAQTMREPLSVSVGAEETSSSAVPANLSLYSNVSWSTIYGQTTNTTCFSNVSTTVYLYRNGTQISSGTSYVSDINALAGGTYGYTCYVANASVTATNVSQSLQVNKMTLNLSISNNATWSVTYPATTKVNCTANASVSFGVYRNGTSVGGYEINQLAAGAYNYTCNYSGDENYSSALAQSNLAVLVGSCTTHLALNGTTGNQTYVLNATVNASAWFDCGQGRGYLIYNTTPVANGTGVLTNISYYTATNYVNFTYNYSGSTNYSNSVTTYFANMTAYPVSWSQNQTNTTAAGLTTKFSLLWQAASSNLDYYLFTLLNLNTHVTDNFSTTAFPANCLLWGTTDPVLAWDLNQSTYTSAICSAGGSGYSAYYYYNTSLDSYNSMNLSYNYTAALGVGATACRLSAWNYSSLDWEDLSSASGGVVIYYKGGNVSISGNYVNASNFTRLRFGAESTAVGSVYCNLSDFRYWTNVVNTSWTPFSSPSTAWSNYSVLTSPIAGTNYSWYYQVNLTDGSPYSSDVYTLTTTNYTISYSNNQTNNTVFSLPTLFSLYWQTTVSDLSYYLFSYSINGTAFVNASWQAFSATNNTWSNATLTLGGLNTTFDWLVYVNDSAGHLFKSSTYSLNTTNYIVNITAFDEETLEQLVFNVSFYNGTAYVEFTNQTNFSASAPLGSNQITINNYSGGYYPRQYLISQTDNVIRAYLLKIASGNLIRLHVLTASSAPISGATITVFKQIAGVQTMVGQGTTDSTGILGVYLSPTTSYIISISASGYIPLNSSVTPTSADYYFQLSSGASNVSLNDSYAGITFLINPIAPYGIPASKTSNITTLTFNITALYNDLVGFGVNYSYYYLNGTRIPLALSKSASTPSGGGFASELNSTALKNLTATIWWTKNGYSTIAISYEYAIASNYSGATVHKGIQDWYNSQVQTGNSTLWTLFLLPIILAGIAGAWISRYTLWGGAVVALVILGFFMLDIPNAMGGLIWLLCALGFFGLVALYRT